MTQFRKKPVVIEAKQATGTPESNREIIDWTRGSATPASMDDHPRARQVPEYQHPGRCPLGVPRRLDHQGRSGRVLPLQA